MIECVGLTSVVFLDTMTEDIELSLSACAFMTRFMSADQPYSDVVRMDRESTIPSLTITFSRLSPSTSFTTFSMARTRLSSPSASSHRLHQVPIAPSSRSSSIFNEFPAMLKGKFILREHHVQNIETLITKNFQKKKSKDDTMEMLSPVMS